MRLWVFVFLVVPQLLLAETLTLQQARERALQSNNLLKAQASKVEAAEAVRNQATSYRLPSLDINSSYIRTNQPASAFALKMNQKDFSMMDFSMSDPNNPDYLDTYLTSIDLTFPLYTGGQVASAVRAAEAQAEGYSHEYDRKRQELLRQVTEVYLGSLLSGEYVHLITKARDTVARHVKMAEDYFETGFIVESDVLRARVELSKIEDRLITASNKAREARLALNILMGTDPESVFELEPVTNLPELSGEELDAAVDTALISRPDLQFMNSMIEALEHNVSRMEGQRLPSLGIKVSQEWYDDSFLGDTGDATTFAVGLTVPVFSGGRIKSEVGEARAHLSEMTHNLKAMEEGVVLQVKQSLYRIEETKSRIGVAKGNEEAAERNLSIVEERYKKGIMKITDLLDADTALTEAYTRTLTARYDYLLAVESYYLATGKEEL
ncbi:MAG TPA: TolC family protein [Thermoanaerobaculia bacterium]|nr:TolC family protein [Thermoanaerobaculia bacterium]HUM31117.1 TolC family protein [Thermoanaerobaculia bacterium]HXK69484.1 TolC family protein [Thermoanaerobaculia bacterium]